MKDFRLRIYNDPILRDMCEPVTDIKSATHLFQIMESTTLKYNGIGLAAPQIGVSLRLAVINYNNERILLINPEVLEVYGETTLEEGCLCFPGIYHNIVRPDTVVLKNTNLVGEKKIITLEGFIARLCLHEIDHLNGKMIIDYMNEFEKINTKNKLKKLGVKLI